VWGDLWHFPFWADVWGTVASWFGAVGTVASVATAAFYYVKNQRREEKAQSRHVTFVSSHWTRHGYHAKVHNFSDESIFDVTPMQGKKFSFREAVANEYREKGPLSKEAIEDLRERWNNTMGGTMHVQSLESGHVKPGGTKEVVFHGPRSPTENYWIEFRDSMARKWQLELDNREPYRVRDDRDREYKWRDIFLRRRRRAYLQYRKKQKELNLWLDNNLE
jgi:hypothetical protein